MAWSEQILIVVRFASYTTAYVMCGAHCYQDKRGSANERQTYYHVILSAVVISRLISNVTAIKVVESLISVARSSLRREHLADVHYNRARFLDLTGCKFHVLAADFNLYR